MINATETRRWESVDRDDRLSHIGQVVLRTPKLLEGLAALNSTFQRYRTRAEGSGLLMLGDTRTGKTTTLNEFLYDMAEQQGLTYVKTTDPANNGTVGETAVTYLERREPGEDLERPVMCIQVGNKLSYNSLLREVITAVTEKKVTGITEHGSLVHELCKQLIGQRTKMIIFDDVNNIAEHKGKEALHSAAEVFKLLMKIARVQVALVGMESAAALCRSNKQLHEMVPRRYHLAPYARPGTAGKELEFSHFLRDLRKEMPFDQPCPIDDAACALRLHVLTEGRPGSVSLLLTDAIEYALEKKLPLVNQDVLAMVLRHYRAIPDEENVFLLDGNDLGPHAERLRQTAIKPPKTSA
jgi:hypothetical protein